MKKILDCTDDFNKLVSDCEENLFNQDVIEFVHNGYTAIEMKKAFEQNSEQMSQLNSDVNIYALWSKEGDDEEWSLKYIGQRKKGSLHQRIQEHLFYKNKETGSRLKKVQEEIKNGNRMGVTAIGVLPDELRSAVEESLISINNTGDLWNIHSNRK